MQESAPPPTPAHHFYFFLFYHSPVKKDILNFPYDKEPLNIILYFIITSFVPAFGSTDNC